jgi:NADH-quinone oxidoreductase subunit J
MGYVAFWVLALPTLAAAAAVVLAPSPVYSALALVATLFFLAVYFLFLGAHLIAWLQVIVYAGAIMVLFLFVIMLLNLQRETKTGVREAKPLVWAAAALLGLQVLVLARGFSPGDQSPLPDGFGSVAAVGASLFTDFLLPFEITSILLLVAVVGAVVLAKRSS